jgi:3-dehydroquinate synthase
VVLGGLAKPTRLEGPDPALLQAAYAEISADTAGQAVSLS